MKVESRKYIIDKIIILVLFTARTPRNFSIVLDKFKLSNLNKGLEIESLVLVARLNIIG